MSRKTGIEWTDATWNPIRGCSRVSEGCRNCYAETVANRFCRPGSPYEGVVQIGADGKGNGKWNGEIKFVEKHLLDPLKWKPVFLKCDVCGVQQYQCLCEEFNHRPRRIFVNSMSDLFHEKVTDEMLDKIFAVMALCPWHTFQVLTKRPERMRDYLQMVAEEKDMQRWINAAFEIIPDVTDEFHKTMENSEWPLPNVRLGVSVEDQKAADDRLDYIAHIAGLGWSTMVSFEPLLGPVDPTPLWFALGANTWAIVGGESGPGARPMHPDWVRSLRDQCVAAGVPFFFKQWGEWSEYGGGDGWSRTEDRNGTVYGVVSRDREILYGGRDFQTYHFPYPGGLGPCMVRVGKKAAGRLLDGREWNEMPA